MRMLGLFLAACWVGSAAAQGLPAALDPGYHDEPKWKQVCAAAVAKPLKVPSAAGPLQGKALETCDETALYYGFAGKPDYAAALQCGWWQRAHPQPSVGNMFYGPGVLMMLYANGRGVPRDYTLALRFACEEEWSSEAESAGRVGHLEALASPNAPAKLRGDTFDLCDDITSGLSMGACESIDTRGREAKRAVKVNAIANALPAAAKALFPKLQAAEASFEEARTHHEVDLSGTARTMFSLQEEALLSDQFLINLQRFGRGDVPAAGAADLAQLDKKLNDIYAVLQHTPKETWTQSGTIDAEGIRQTERAWLPLVEAWVVFARAAYPNVSETQVRAQLIRLRLHQLQSLRPQ